MKRTVFVLVFVFMFFVASTAMAQVNFGVKYLSLTNLYMPPAGYYGIFHYSINQALGFNLGFDATPQVVILGGLDINQVSWTYENDASDTEDKFSASSFTPNAGIKFYFRERTENSVSPYIFGGFFKTFTSLDLGKDADKDAEDYFKNLNSPFGFIPAFGAEYFFSENFSFGGETGLRFSFAKGEYKYDVGDKDYTDEATYKTISHYIALTLNFRF